MITSKISRSHLSLSIHTQRIPEVVCGQMDPTQDSGIMELCRKIFLEGVRAVLPGNLIMNRISKIGSKLQLDSNELINLNEFKAIHILGFGKAVLPMAETLIQILESNVKNCVINVPVGTRSPIQPMIEMYRGARNNIPDADAFKGAQRIVDVASHCGTSDLLFVLISGGGSALFPYPKPPITLLEKGELVRTLSKNGADIRELNLVRREMSLVKGGGLLRITKAKTVVSLILSDVLGDDLDIIASGPTVPPSQSPVISPLEILEKYLSPISQISPTILKVLQDRTESPFHFQSSPVKNLIIGNNRIALEAAAAIASASKHVPIIMTSVMEGEARLVGEKIAQLSIKIAELMENFPVESEFKNLLQNFVVDLKIEVASLHEIWNGVKEVLDGNYRGLCLLFGGETTVRVTGNGLGGRNQELVLSAAMALHQFKSDTEIVICSGGTDGMDGPCDAAGAIALPSTVSRVELGLDPIKFLQNNDSYSFFKRLSDGKFHLVTGHTETNVMDMIICLLFPKSVEAPPISNP